MVHPEYDGRGSLDCGVSFLAQIGLTGVGSARRRWYTPFGSRSHNSLGTPPSTPRERGWRHRRRRRRRRFEEGNSVAKRGCESTGKRGDEKETARKREVRGGDEIVVYFTFSALSIVILPLAFTSAFYLVALFLPSLLPSRSSLRSSHLPSSGFRRAFARFHHHTGARAFCDFPFLESTPRYACHISP